MPIMTIKDLSRIECLIDEEIEYSKGMSRYSNSEFATAENAINSTKATIESAVMKLDDLIEIKFHIRSLKSEFNKNNGIDEKTIDIAKLNSKIDFIEITALNKQYPTKNNYSYGSKDELFGAGLDAETIDEYRYQVRSFKRQIQKLKDSCNGINSQSKIEIEQSIYDLMVTYKLIED